MAGIKKKKFGGWNKKISARIKKKFDGWNKKKKFEVRVDIFIPILCRKVQKKSILVSEIKTK